MEQFFERFSYSIIIVVITVLICYVVKSFVNHIFKVSVKRVSHKKSLTIMKMINNIIKTIIIIISILTIISVWGIDTKALLTSLGIVGLVAGLAIQDMLKDIIAGASIIFENEFDVGDNIQIGSFRGDVIDITLQTITIRAYTGEIKIISNRNVTEVINYSRYPSKAIIDFGISYDADKTKLDEAINKMLERINALKFIAKKAEYLGVQSLEDSAVIHRIAVDCKPTKDIPCKREALKIVKEECDNAKIEIPFSQVVVHDAV